jgi:NCAIR mutase (PurE)-related protein
MNREELEKLLRAVQRSRLPVEEALKRLRHLPTEGIGFARIDHHRALRQGLPEVILCEGKRPEQVAAILQRMRKAGSDLLATRAGPEVYRKVKRVIPRAVYHDAARMITLTQTAGRRRPIGNILILTAGTSDIPVAEEARVTAEMMGSRVSTAYDVGVAGLHRLLDLRDPLLDARVIVVAAGMEGALPSVVGGLVDRPVVAVPTGRGYGTGFGGWAALLAMLNSCAPGVAVMNIDNGFGAGVLAHRINRMGGQ